MFYRACNVLFQLCVLEYHARYYIPIIPAQGDVMILFSSGGGFRGVSNETLFVPDSVMIDLSLIALAHLVLPLSCAH